MCARREKTFVLVDGPDSVNGKRANLIQATLFQPIRDQEKEEECVTDERRFFGIAIPWIVVGGPSETSAWLCSSIDFSFPQNRELYHETTCLE